MTEEADKRMLPKTRDECHRNARLYYRAMLQLQALPSESEKEGQKIPLQGLRQDSEPTIHPGTFTKCKRAPAHRATRESHKGDRRTGV